MTEAMISRTARVIADDIIDRAVMIGVMDKAALATYLRDVMRKSLSADEPELYSVWAMNRLRLLAQTGNTTDQIFACETIVRCTASLLEAAKS